MDNIKYAIKQGKLLLEIDLSRKGEETKGGNSMCATSNNWSRFDEMPGWSFNMVLVRKPGAQIPPDSPDETMVERPRTMAQA